MKKTAIMIVTLAGLGGLAGVLMTEAAGQATTAPKTGATKVAVCDIPQVIDGYQYAKDLGVKQRDQASALEAEDKKREKQIESNEAMLKELNPGSAEYETTFKELTRLTMDREVWRKTQEQIALREYANLTRKMYDETVKMIAAVAKDQGYQVVLSAENVSPPADDIASLSRMMERRKVLYSDGSVDITGTVLERLNAAYKAKGK